MLNPFFLQGSQGEQGLVQDLINEQLRMYGLECHYIPRKLMTSRTIMREVTESRFDQAFPLEAYLMNVDGGTQKAWGRPRGVQKEPKWDSELAQLIFPLNMVI